MARSVDLSDPYLFGNDAAGDEEEDVFSSYVIDRDEASLFADSEIRIAIVRAHKGDGKSALLRLSRMKIADQSQAEALILEATATDITGGSRRAVHQES